MISENRNKEKKHLILRQVNKSYPEAGRIKNVLINSELEVPKGQILVILGKSGSGKTTLLNLIGGIDTPDSGRIIISDSEVSAMDETERTLFRRNNIGFIFQFFNLIPTLTVSENLLLPLELKGINSNAKDRVRNLLHQIGLSDRNNSFPDVLSGGEQQRVAVARAVIHNPDIILADEPTGSLDMETGRQIAALLEKLVRDGEKTLILATHSREILPLADRILTIENGILHEIEYDKIK